MVEQFLQLFLPGGGVDEEVFGEEEVGAGGPELVEPFGVLLGREQGDRRLAEGGERADPAAQLDAVHAGQVDVEEEEVRPVRLEVAPGLLGRGEPRERLAAAVAELAEEAA